MRRQKGSFHAWRAVAEPLLLRVWPGIGHAHQAIVLVHLLRVDLIKLRIAHAQGLLHHDWCRFPLAPTGLVVGIPNSVTHLMVK